MLQNCMIIIITLEGNCCISFFCQRKKLDDEVVRGRKEKEEWWKTSSTAPTGGKPAYGARISSPTRRYCFGTVPPLDLGMACHASFNAYIYKLPHHHPAEKSHDCITAFLMLIFIALSLVPCIHSSTAEKTRMVSESRKWMSKGMGKWWWGWYYFVLFCFVEFEMLTASRAGLSFKRAVMLDPSNVFSVCATVKGLPFKHSARARTAFRYTSTKSYWFKDWSPWMPAILNAFCICSETCSIQQHPTIRHSITCSTIWRALPQGFAMAQDVQAIGI